MLTKRHRVPALFLYTLKEAGSLEFVNTIKLTGNPLDVGIVDSAKLVVAVDTSTNAAAGDHDLKKSLLKVEQRNGEYQVSEGLIQDIPELEDTSAEILEDELQKLLYTAETLRKLDLEEGGPDGE